MADKKADSNFPLDQHPLEGQAAFPGFEIPPAEVEPEPETEPAEAPDPEPLTTADAISEAARKISWQVDFIRSPEDALIAWGAPAEYMRDYLSYHFEQLVKEVARQTGADPEQIRDKDKRTPEQQRRLSELAGQEMVARHDVFLESIYSDALSTIFALQLQGYPTENGTEIELGAESDLIAEQSVIYFFALHGTITPLSKGELTPDQEEELRVIYKKLDAFYKERAEEIGAENIKYWETLSAFIRQENPSESKAEAIIEKLPLLQSINPKSHTMPNNALMNALQQKDIINTGAGDLIVAKEQKKKGRGRRKEITAYTMVTYNPGETGIKLIGAKLTEYERQVSDAIISLCIEAGKEGVPPVFTPDMIYRAMPGGGEKASERQRASIIQTIEKFRRLHIVLDATEEMRNRNKIGPTATYKIDTFYLNVTHAEYRAKNGGQTVDAYKVESEPIILTYCKKTEQILTVPAEYIAIEKVKQHPITKQLERSGELVMMNAERQAMTGYILRRIAVMKHDYEEAKEKYRSYNRRRKKDPSLEPKPLSAFREQTPVILFSTLFADAGLTNLTKQDANRNRNFVKQVLDYQKAVGNIPDYKVQTKGRSKPGVEILLDK